MVKKLILSLFLFLFSILLFLNSNQFINIGLHSLISVLIFFLVMQMGTSVMLAFASSLLFASHPIHTEVICSLAGRVELIHSLFFLGALFLFVKSKEFVGKKRLLVIALSPLAFLVSLLAKGSAIVFPAVIIAHDMAFSKEPFPGKKERRESIFCYMLFVMAAILFLGIKSIVFGNPMGSVGVDPVSNPLSQEGLYGRFLGATKVFGKYLLLLVFPLRLSPDYSFNQIKLPESIRDISVLLPLALLFILLSMLFKTYRRSGLIFFSILFFIVTFSIVSNYFFTIETIMSESLIYLPSFSFCMMLALFLTSKRSGRRKPKKAMEMLDGFKAYQIAVLCLVVLLYSVRTFTRNLDWKDDYSLFSSAERVSPGSVRVLNNYGAVLLKMRMYDEAVERFKKALSMYPGYLDARSNLARAYFDKGDVENADKEVRRVLAIEPGLADAQRLLGKILLRSEDLRGAERTMKEAITKDSKSVILYNDLGLLYTTWKRYPDAVEAFQKAIELDPGSATIWSNLGTAYRCLNKYEEAMNCFKKALEILPDNAAILYNLGLAYMDQGKSEMALAEFKKIIDSEPNNHEAMTKSGYLLISMGRYEEGIAFLTRAIEANARSEDAYLARGKAYTILGKYDEALGDYSKVIELNPDSIAAMNNRGTIYALRGEYDKARAEWEEALERAPDEQEIRLNLEKLNKMKH
ncbi:MAG: tetratricopeptide repeat protein [Acidobacteriota bacterium]